MDGLATDFIIKVASTFGVPGIIFVVWYFSERSRDKTMAAYREDTLRMAKTYEDGLAEVRQMYKNNVLLVEGYARLASEQKDVIIMATAEVQKLSDKVDQNQFCPMVRLKKAASGREI